MDKGRKFKYFLAGYLALIGMTVWAVNRINWSLSVPLILEMLGCLAILALPFFYRPLRVFVGRLPRPHLYFLAIIMFCLFVGQLIPAPRTTFPFVPWQMFGRPQIETEVLYYEYWGKEKSGGRVQVFPSILFPSLEDGRVSGGLKHRLWEIIHSQASAQRRDPKREKPLEQDQAGQSAGKKILKSLGSITRTLMVDEYAREANLDERIQQFNSLLIAIGKMHNRRYAQQPIHSLEMHQCFQSLTDRETSLPNCETIWQVEVD